MQDSPTKTDYVKRVNKVFQYIDDHLKAPLSLEEISEVGHFSPFHFHRVFKTITGEALNAYIVRRRVEKAASLLMHKLDFRIGEIAWEVGFASNTSFARAFKKEYGLSPSEFRKSNAQKIGKIIQKDSKNGQVFPKFENYICSLTELKHWIVMNGTIEIKEMPKMQLAYVTSIGVQNITSAYGRLMQWAEPLGLLKDAQMITVYHDSFKVTAPNKVRMSAGLILNENVQAEGEVGITTVKAGKCIVGRFEIGLCEFEKSWSGLFVWMNENGYEKADRNPFEIYHNNFEEHPEKKCIVDFCIPVV
ncbi:AraC family transcriptional regulator [Aureisphaera galaxeae]|uniref:AraC family transcriptional regulator n=1 Tax=Aureisphaera galaxeae TaxID=1538023 RepID=UPI00234FDFA4|nr:AraC family transcriptional regulator [Aureisphaera galaxeae]MDC8005496.1 AraC family transcriptional regulator [Aureisphaera galaxeae]